jgi:glycosyltransferase involved in cell wall biosynthesis
MATALLPLVTPSRLTPERPPPEPSIEVSVVMPCLNEVRTVGRCVEKARRALDRFADGGEVIVADNGSTDGSQEVARAHGARVVAVTSRGYGNALRGGIAAARGTYVVMGDADDSYDFGNLEPFITRLRAGDELVMGNRFKGGIEPGAMPWLHRYVGNPVLSGLLNLFFRTPIGDAHCGLRAFRKDTYERLGLASTGMEFASEMVVKAALCRARMSEVPIRLYPDGRDRPPHLRSFRDGWRHLRFLLLMCPLWLYLLPAVALLGGGLGLLAWRTLVTPAAGGAAPGLHLLWFGCLGLVLGHQLFWFWAFAKTFGCSSGLLAGGGPPRPLAGMTLERGLTAGAVGVLSGLGLTVLACARWGDAGTAAAAAPLTMPCLAWGVTLVLLGAQMIGGAFFLSLLRMPTGTGQGAGTAPAAR